MIEYIDIFGTKLLNFCYNRKDNFLDINTIIDNKSISRKALERLDLLLLALETIDLNGTESMYTIINTLNLKDIIPTKVSLWQLRCSNPMRKSYKGRSIKLNEFEALIRITSEMAKYLYPYIRSILSSKDNYKLSPHNWNNFQLRYTELIKERFNTESIIVQKIIDTNYNRDTYIKVLLNLALCISDDGDKRLKMVLLNL